MEQYKEVAVEKNLFDKVVRYLISRPYCEVEPLLALMNSNCRPLEYDRKRGGEK